MTTSTIAGKTFVDTNVLVYAHDEDEPAKRERALRLLASLEGCVISAQVMAEFYSVATRKWARPKAADDAAKAVHEMAKWVVVPVDAALVDSAVALSRRAKLSLWDAMIVRAATAAGCDRLLTEDLQHGAVIDGIRIENPFA